MNRSKEELDLAEAVLELIERRRATTGDRELGSAIERAILEQEIRGLEHEIFENPGALEAMLVPIRRR
jgi:hypothetical protein